MPSQINQLPPGPTDLAQRVRDLENQMREMRAARRMKSAAVGRLRLYAADGQTLLAELGPTPDSGGGLTTWGLQAGDDTPVSATLSSGELTFQPSSPSFTGVPANVAYSALVDLGSDLVLSSGAARPSDWRSVVDLGSVTDGGVPNVVVSGFREVGGVGESGAANVIVQGVLTAANIAYGTATITPSAANTPTSMTVSGLGLSGSSFYAQVTPQTTVPGTQVTGVGASGVSSNGLTLWVTRTNTTATIVNWLVIGV
ncbi:hypothetical protein [Streptomyces bauhiniae]|uniref:Uncharacterized protein n=1 Tax=Streptomyces bauhiniae TaxID=2340725 RepID=A0A7K3QRC7_9ACTN|nr:hypothetical protein [Streptomyces bauhiniae]NEB92457.1 hypothetical protein [Streptomyces bauhiniae]